MRIKICVVFFCHDGKGNFVMAKRSKNTRNEHGVWDIGAGEVEFGDSVEKTLRKEIKEEYSAEVLFCEFLGFREVTRYGKKHEHWIALDFKVLVDRKDVKIGEPDKFDEIGWFTLSKLPSPLYSQEQDFFKKYKHKL